MNEKQQKIVEAAIGVFSRYGVRRATMGDIAEQSGISRQTLYASYASKEEMLAAAVGHVAELSIERIEAAWEIEYTLEGRINTYFQHAVIDHFESIKSMPDLNDLLTGFSDAGGAVLEKAVAQKAGMLSMLFEPYSDNLKAADMTPADLADFVHSTSHNVLYTARDEAHLRRLLASLRSSVLSLVGR